MKFSTAYSGLVKKMFLNEAESEVKLKKYRDVIKEKFSVDISGWGATEIPGGKSEGHSVTEYELQELIWGIEVEFEHTSNALVALEIAMDHLQEMPDYYTRLREMERKAKIK